MSDENMTRLEEVVNDVIIEKNVFDLANLADCRYDKVDSAGARFLTGVADNVADRAEEIVESQYPEDVASEIADSAVPIYIHERFDVLVDTQAYYEDEVTELATEGSNLIDLAGYALYIMADRLARALIEELVEAYNATEEDGDDTEDEELNPSED